MEASVAMETDREEKALEHVEIQKSSALTLQPGKLLKQGAEARVFVSTFMGRKAVIKERFSKRYRHPVLDSKLTSKRLLGTNAMNAICACGSPARLAHPNLKTREDLLIVLVCMCRKEARSLTKARKLGVRTPVLYALDPARATLTFEFVPGPTVKETLIESGCLPTADGKLEEVAAQIGKAIAKLHDGGLIHGDLTTSNMLLHEDSNQLVVIDFGLAFTSSLPEDKAVDLYVLERALVALHSSNGDIMQLVLASYRHSSKLWSSTLNKLAAVRMRGRKRVMVG